MVEAARSCVAAKSGSLTSITKSVGIGAAGMRLLINANTMCLCAPMGFVKQTAGRTLVAVKSSNGKGSRTILFFSIEWLAVGRGVNVLLWIRKVGERWISCGGPEPVLLSRIGLSW
jgi:hypothetical protein